MALSVNIPFCYPRLLQGKSRLILDILGRRVKAREPTLGVSSVKGLNLVSNESASI
jgi:hypothetical protein